MKRNSAGLLDKRVLHCWVYNWTKTKELGKLHPDIKTFRWFPRIDWQKFPAPKCVWDGGPYNDEYQIEIMWLYTGFAIRYGEKR